MEPQSGPHISKEDSFKSFARSWGVNGNKSEKKGV